ncbi:MAG: sugar ABC transporter permease, partial [Lachnospiraceae bacterium]|nr:sugar ABC transporter permease [Lachnospiraceae bacterium]
FEMKNSYVIMESTGVMDLLDDLLANFGLPDKVVSTVRGYLDNIFSIAWASGIQIVLFIIGLQAIPSYLYEVCELEGATKWETFWKITFPLLSPSMLLCMIYTIIVQFNSGNTVMTAIEDNMRMKMHYACAQTWMYTLVVGAFVFVAYRLVAKRTVYLD